MKKFTSSQFVPFALTFSHRFSPYQISISNGLSFAAGCHQQLVGFTNITFSSFGDKNFFSIKIVLDFRFQSQNMGLLFENECFATYKFY